MRRTTMNRTVGGAAAAAGLLAMASAAAAQNFAVASQGCWGDLRSEAFYLDGGCTNTFLNNSGQQQWSGWGEIGGVPRVYLDARHIIDGCCNRQFFPQIRSYYNLVDLEITGSGGAMITAQCTVDVFAFHDLWYECDNCPPDGPATPDPPTSSMQVIFGHTGGDDVVLNAPTTGWHSLTWTGVFNTAQPSLTWNVDVQGAMNMTITTGTQQVSLGELYAVALLGPVNADGTIGPVFTFPDCPTCSANAPSINLIDNYIHPMPGTCIADVDNDEDTDLSDFSQFATNFGRTDLLPGTGGDLDYDGDCDLSDFARFASNFGCVG